MGFLLMAGPFLMTGALSPGLGPRFADDFLTELTGGDQAIAARRDGRHPCIRDAAFGN
jgi:hypothetical protein